MDAAPDGIAFGPNRFAFAVSGQIRIRHELPTRNQAQGQFLARALFAKEFAN
jgi:hypothetical protein